MPIQEEAAAGDRGGLISRPGDHARVREANRAVRELSGPRRRRIIELDLRIRRGKYPNCTTFARHWREVHGEEVSTKTIQRDLEWLSTAGAPLEYDYRRKGYFYRPSSDWTLPFLDVTEAELVHVLLARQMAEQFRGAGLAETLGTLFERMTMLLPERAAVDPLVLRRSVTFHPAPARPVAPEVWTALLRALRQGVAVRLQYRAGGRSEIREHEVEPVHLACVEDEWYLIAWNPRTGRMTHFAVPRIAQVELTDWPCELREFDPQAYVSNRFGRWIGGPGERQVRVELRFDPSAAPYVRERPIHHPQKLRPARDGGATVTFSVPEGAVETTLQAAVLAWGGQVTVIRPETLRRAVLKAARAAVARHRRPTP